MHWDLYDQVMKIWLWGYMSTERKSFTGNRGQVWRAMKKRRTPYAGSFIRAGKSVLVL